LLSHVCRAGYRAERSKSSGCRVRCLDVPKATQPAGPDRTFPKEPVEHYTSAPSQPCPLLPKKMRTVPWRSISPRRIKLHVASADCPKAACVCVHGWCHPTRRSLCTGAARMDCQPFPMVLPPFEAFPSLPADFWSLYGPKTIRPPSRPALSSLRSGFPSTPITASVEVVTPVVVVPGPRPQGFYPAVSPFHSLRVAPQRMPVAPLGFRSFVRRLFLDFRSITRVMAPNPCQLHRPHDSFLIRFPKDSHHSCVGVVSPLAEAKETRASSRSRPRGLPPQPQTPLRVNSNRCRWPM